MDNIVSIHLPAYNAKTRPLYQHDYGQLLQISGIELPENFEAQFTNSMTKQTVTMLGSDNTVEIPDALLAESTDVICYVFLHHTEDDGETRYKIIIPVIPRPKPSENTPTPVQQDIITQAIAALETAVTEAEAAQAGAEAAAAVLENCTATATTLDAGSDATAEYNDGTFAFGIPRGADGEDGADGISPTVTVTDITGGHRVKISDINGNHTFDVMDGVDGNAATVSVGTTTTGAAGSQASVTNSGTSSAAVLNFTIPKGDTGESGDMIVEAVSGSNPVIVGVAKHRYVCGEVATISITPPSSGMCDVVFESGSTAAVLTLPNTVIMPDWFVDVEANMIYEINIMDGIYGAVMSWQTS